MISYSETKREWTGQSSRNLQPKALLFLKRVEHGGGAQRKWAGTDSASVQWCIFPIQHIRVGSADGVPSLDDGANRRPGESENEASTCLKLQAVRENQNSLSLVSRVSTSLVATLMLA